MSAVHGARGAAVPGDGRAAIPPGRAQGEATLFPRRSRREPGASQGLRSPMTLPGGPHRPRTPSRRSPWPRARRSCSPSRPPYSPSGGGAPGCSCSFRPHFSRARRLIRGAPRRHRRHDVRGPPRSPSWPSCSPALLAHRGRRPGQPRPRTRAPRYGAAASRCESAWTATGISAEARPPPRLPPRRQLHHVAEELGSVEPTATSTGASSHLN